MIHSFSLFLQNLNYQNTLGHLNGNYCYFLFLEKYKKYNFISFENFIKPGAKMHLCNEILNAMLDLGFSKQNINNFQKVFDFS